MRENKFWIPMHTFLLKILVFMVIIIALACKFTGKNPLELKRDGLVQSVQTTIEQEIDKNVNSFMDELMKGL